jgi:site-specific recombinase XerD
MLALVDTCRQDPSGIGARDAALLAVLYSGGLRRAEAVALDLADFDPESGALVVRHGKGNKARTVYAAHGARAALVAWIEARGAKPGLLFYRGRKGGALVPEQITPQAVLDILRRRAQQAGVARFSPHDLRRTFVSELLDAGADVATVRALAGHANVETTTRYDRRGEQAKRRAAEMLHFPFAGGEGPG